MFALQNKPKIINDPVLGFITIPNEFVYELIGHPLFQRLSRIRQLGLANVVYPGAQHTRFNHSLGAMHLAGEAMRQLRDKGHVISDTERNAVLFAMLLHDIGHGPFSHVLENTLVCGVDHEEVSLMLMEQINEQFEGRLSTAIAIFTDRYPRRFLHQLISSQLDMDRLDYLRRDAFYTGVSEGQIGASRIIKMLEVCDDQLVVESKGIYSIENFLIARRYMYWQVYLHKTSVAAEKHLIKILSRAKELIRGGRTLFATPALEYFLENEVDRNRFMSDPMAIENYTSLDDSDILSAVKVWQSDSDTVLSTLSRAFVDRRIFKSVTGDALQDYDRNAMRNRYAEKLDIPFELTRYFIEEDDVCSNTYNPDGAAIMILRPDNTLADVAHLSDMFNVDMLRHVATKHYLFYLQL